MSIRYRLGRWLLMPWLRAALLTYGQKAAVSETPEGLHQALNCCDLLRQFIDGRASRRWSNR